MFTAFVSTLKTITDIEFQLMRKLVESSSHNSKTNLYLKVACNTDISLISLVLFFFFFFSSHSHNTNNDGYFFKKNKSGILEF